MPDRFPALPEEQPTPAPLKAPPVPNRAPVRRARPGDRARNLISVVFLLATCGVIAYIALLWNDPYSALNPLAPPTPLPVVITATFTPTPTYTPSPTLTPSQTFTPSAIPSIQPTPTFTPIFLEGFSTPQGTPPAPDEVVDAQFVLSGNRVLYITNPDGRGGCNWSSIAGSVVDAEGAAINGYRVRIVGEDVDEVAITGSAPGFGPGGFELRLGSAARDAQYVAQLFDADDAPMSTVYTVDTRSDCSLNITALRFVPAP